MALSRIPKSVEQLLDVDLDVVKQAIGKIVYFRFWVVMGSHHTGSNTALHQSLGSFQ